MPRSLSERVPYVAIVDRPPLKLPGGARLAVWLIVNIENWETRAPNAADRVAAPLGSAASARPTELGLA